MSDTKLRILHVIEPTLGGTKRYIEDVFYALENVNNLKLGLIYSLNRSEPSFLLLLEKLRKNGVELFEVPMVRSISPISDLQAALKIRAIIKKFKPNIIHCHSSKAGGLVRLLKLLFQVNNTVKTVYTPNELATSIAWYYGLIETLLLPVTDRLIAVTEAEKKRIIRDLNVTTKKVSVVSPLISAHRFVPQSKEEARKRLNVSQDKFLVIALGRLAHQKRPEIFVDIACRLLQVLPSQVDFLWVGDGPLRHQIEDLIKKKKMDGVLKITGWVSDVRDFIAAADIVVMPSKYESFGYVAAETMAMERVVVVSDVPALQEVVGNKTLVFQNSEEAVEIIIRLLSNTEQLNTIAQELRQSVTQRFSKERMKDSLLNVYCNLLIDKV
ncbi:glycosyltransferase [Thermonema rossianum]|uniref:glycosyltransferase n=1 Tax=Thermonema rossianum TaxID=55505 RepID=UPI000570B763|nr:glycosyltransferase [Thermonema rossianum]